MTSIFEGQLPQNKPFSNQNKGHLGSRYPYMTLCVPTVARNINQIKYIDIPYIDPNEIQ